MNRLAGMAFAIALSLLSNTVYGAKVPQIYETTDSEVVLFNENAGITLGGTLTLPDSEKSPDFFVVFASGSGAQNRDEEVFGHKPFKVIADSLASYGYGSLRMDDRGVGGSTGIFENATINDLTSDIFTGIDYIKNEYPHAKVGVVGHSQGGLSAINAAAMKKADFIITLASPAWPGDSIIMSQCRALAVATTGSWPGEQIERRLLDIAKSAMPAYVAKPLIFSELSKVYGEAAKMPQIQEQIYSQIEPMLSNAYRDLLRYNPESDIRSVEVPWLALNGTKDFQVLCSNLQTIGELCPSATTVEVPGHNHLFQEALTGMPDEYGRAAATPSDTTVKLIIDWLNDIVDKDLL